MSDMTEPNPKVTFIPNQQLEFVVRARPMTDEEQECDCGCMDYERDPAADLTFYAEPQDPKPAGVSPGYLVVRRPGQPVEVANIALLHDGEGNTVGQIDQTSWRTGEIVDES